MSLRFQIRWSPGEATDALEASCGELGAWVDNECVWGKAEGETWTGVEWPLIEVLEHLSRVWPFLIHEERDPFGIIDPASAPPSRLRALLEAQWRLNPSTDEDERLLARFELTHDLSKAFNGAWPPFLWLVRCGAKFLIESTQVLRWFDDCLIIQSLEQLGDEIADKIQPYTDGRGLAALNQWSQRRNTSLRRLLNISTGLPVPILEEISGNLPFDIFWELNNSQPFECRELVAAARMASQCLSTKSLSNVLGFLRETKRHETPKLDAFCQEYTSRFANRPFEKPYEEGHFAAEWLREKEHLGTAPLVESELLLNSWNVEIGRLALDERGIDAIAAWGPLHGPLVLLNTNGSHVRHLGALNVTLAHEICHLIIDRQEALPVAEVLGGKVMESVEARARAFAAELLLPRSQAYMFFRDQVDRGYKIESVVRQLSRRFMVSKEVVAWQIRNAQSHLTDSEHRGLRYYVRQYHSF